MKHISFFVAGKPRAKQSFRYTKNGGGFTPKETKEWQTQVGYTAKEAMKDAGFELFTGNLRVTLLFYMPDNHRTDCDNLSKNCLDGCNGVVYLDDKQITRLTIEKSVDRANPGVHIFVWED